MCGWRRINGFKASWRGNEMKTVFNGRPAQWLSAIVTAHIDVSSYSMWRSISYCVVAAAVAIFSCIVSRW